MDKLSDKDLAMEIRNNLEKLQASVKKARNAGLRVHCVYPQNIFDFDEDDVEIKIHRDY